MRPLARLAWVVAPLSLGVVGEAEWVSTSPLAQSVLVLGATALTLRSGFLWLVRADGSGPRA